MSFLHRSTFVTVCWQQQRHRAKTPTNPIKKLFVAKKTICCPIKKLFAAKTIFTLSSFCQKQQSCAALDNSKWSLKQNCIKLFGIFVQNTFLSLANSVECVDEWEVKVKELGGSVRNLAPRGSIPRAVFGHPRQLPDTANLTLFTPQPSLCGKYNPQRSKWKSLLAGELGMAHYPGMFVGLLTNTEKRN